MNNGKSLSFLKQFGLYSTLVFEITTPPIAGLILGYYIDKRLNTDPWVAIAFLIFGVAVSIKRASFLMRKISQKDE